MRLLSSRQRKIIGAVVLLCLLPAVWFLTRNVGDNVEWLTEPPVPRQSRLGFLGQWKQPVRAQLLRLKYWLFGKPQIIAVRADILELDSPAAISNLVSSPATFSNHLGMQGWIIQDITAWRAWVTNRAVRPLAASTVTTFDGTPVQVSTAERISVGREFRNVGFFLDLSPHVRGESIELTSFIVATERVRDQTNTFGQRNITNVAFTPTNAAFGVRVTLPKGASVFLLASHVTNDHGKVVGALLSPTVWPRK